MDVGDIPLLGTDMRQYD